MNKLCKFDGCDGIVRTKEYCGAHYLQLNRGQELKPLRQPTKNEMCSFDGCEKLRKTKDLCQGHHRQVTEGRELKPLRHVNVAAGFRFTGDGYVELFLPSYPFSKKSGYVLEHRYVMEQYLGRPLAKHENVHHKNGVRNDNRLENLELWIRPQPTGQRVEDLLDWVVAQYPDQLKERLV